jgi:hypothetical protein
MVTLNSYVCGFNKCMRGRSKRTSTIVEAACGKWSVVEIRRQPRNVRLCTRNPNSDTRTDI